MLTAKDYLSDNLKKKTLYSWNVLKNTHTLLNLVQFQLFVRNVATKKYTLFLMIDHCCFTCTGKLYYKKYRLLNANTNIFSRKYYL